MVFLARVGEPAASQLRRIADSAGVLLNVEDAGPGTDAARRSTAGRTRDVAVRGRATRRDRRTPATRFNAAAKSDVPSVHK